MILESDHTHIDHTRSKTSPVQKDDSNHILTVLQQLQQQSRSRLTDGAINDIQNLRKFYEEKVYLSYSSTASDYLSHLLNKSGQQVKDHVSVLIQQRQAFIEKAINNQKYDVKINKSSNLKNIRSQLMQKISEMKSGMQNLSQIQQKKQRDEVLYENYIEFRKKGYWNENQQKNEQVKSFLKKMKKIKTHIKKRFESDLQRRQSLMKEHEQQQKRLLQQHRKMLVQKALEKSNASKQKRQKASHQNEIHIKQIKSFLQQYKTDKPLFVVKEEKFKNQILIPLQQERKKKIMQIRKQRQPINAEELEQHKLKYQENREKMLAIQTKLRRQQQAELNEKNESRLKQLYRGHFHSQINEQKKLQQMTHSQRKKQRQRIIQYWESIKQGYLPTIDPKKKQQLQKSIRQLMLSQDKSKIKIIKDDGSVVFEEKSSYDSKALGKSYLQSLKKFNEGKPKKNRQERSSSMNQLSKKPVKIDYLSQMRSDKVRSTLSNWKKVLQKSDMNSKDKYQNVMGHVSYIQQQAQLKQKQLRTVKKDKERSMQLKQQLDKYYLQSVAAKMIVLKDVILKE